MRVKRGEERLKVDSSRKISPISPMSGLRTCKFIA